MEIVYFRWFLPGYFSILCPVQVRRKKSDAWNKIPLTVNNYSIKNISTITLKYLDPNLLSRNVYFIWKKKNVEAWLLIWFTSFWLELTEFQILLSPQLCIQQPHSPSHFWLQNCHVTCKMINNSRQISIQSALFLSSEEYLQRAHTALDCANNYRVKSDNSSRKQF